MDPEGLDSAGISIGLGKHRSLSSSSLNKPDPNMNRSLIRKQNKRTIVTLQKLAQKPGKIFNRRLVYFDEDNELRFNAQLQEGKDYYTVDSKSWELFKKWYGCDVEAVSITIINNYNLSNIDA